MHNELKLIEQCKKGKKKAQKELYENYSPVMFAICMRYATSTPEAEDILQEGFVKVFSNIKDYKEQGSFISWIKRIFINTAITHYHKNKKHRYHLEVSDINELNASTRFDNKTFTKDELFGIIDNLPEGYKMVFNLYAIEGYKHKEIAELLKIDINTSKSQYSRARKLIQSKLIELDSELRYRIRS